jgi:hypothetical protein
MRLVRSASLQARRRQYRRRQNRAGGNRVDRQQGIEPSEESAFVVLTQAVRVGGSQGCIADRGTTDSRLGETQDKCQPNARSAERSHRPAAHLWYTAAE